MQDSDELKESMDNLTKAMKDMTTLFQTANTEIHMEPGHDLAGKFDMLILQNKEIARALITILEIQKEYLPKLVAERKRQMPVMQPMPRPVVPSIDQVPREAGRMAPMPPFEYRGPR